MILGPILQHDFVKKCIINLWVCKNTGIFKVKWVFGVQKWGQVYIISHPLEGDFFDEKINDF